MPHFVVQRFARNDRTGRLSFPEEGLTSIETPYLFPVAFLITGTTARGGATWKYVLQADVENGLMRRNVPLMSQVLSFLDYGIGPSGVQKWRKHSIRQMYKNDVVPELDYRAPIFLDSGGFKLMWTNGLNLDKYGISLTPGHEAESIVRFQRDLGGNLIASLDYPLPPGLSVSETQRRMKRSRDNAIRAATFLRDQGDSHPYKPFLYMAVHGLTSETIQSYVSKLFQDIQKNDLSSVPIGIAIGSMVPLRGAGKAGEIVRLVAAATAAIPERFRERVPVHVFGITGLLVPFLAYSGVDTFDSSTFAQEASKLHYIDPKSRQTKAVLEMDQSDITCVCPICDQINLRDMQQGLVTESQHKPLPNGLYKSKYYADIALHNLTIDTATVEEVRQAIQADCLEDYLIETARAFPRLYYALEAAAEQSSSLKQKAARVSKPAVKPLPAGDLLAKPRTFTHTPKDFNISANGYQLQQTKVLLIIPCSAEKPYSHSSTHRFLSERLDTAIPGWKAHVQKVTLSGLYGPVPLDCETEQAVLDYDFKLVPENTAQIQLCVERLVEFLARHQTLYSHCVAYGTSKAYRMVFLAAAKAYPALKVLPEKPKAQKLTEFFRGTNVEQLLDFVKAKLDG